MNLPGTDLRVSRACLGTMTFGAQTDRAAAARMVDLCLDRGINFFDTANVYNGGESERILGEVLGARRRGVVVASKVGQKVGDHPFGLKRALVLAAVEDSLRRLHTDYLDVYYLHLPDWNTPLEESLGALDTLVRQGKVRCGATSNFASWQICRMLWLAETQGWQAPRVAQPMYNLLARRIEDEYLPFSKQFGISNFVYNPLAGGLLTGKQPSEQPLPGTRFDGNRMYLERYWHQQNFQAVSLLRAAADKAGRSLVSVALNWILHHSAADGLILGASRVEQLEENLGALEGGPLDSSLLAACDEAWQMVKGATPRYNR